MRAAFWIAGITVRELFHEKVLYLLAGFAMLSLGLGAMLGQLTYAEQAKLTLDFMLGGVEISMVLFSIFMSISLFQRELQSGSVAMLLSKPISRWSFLLGKYLGQVAVQIVVITVMGIITLTICLRFPTEVSPLAITQALYLTAIQTTIVSAMTYIFVVAAGGMVTAAASLVLFVVGHFRESISSGVNNTAGQSIWTLMKTVAPNLEVFNMKALASYGQALSLSELGWASLYGLLCIVFSLALSCLIFQERDVQT